MAERKIDLRSMRLLSSFEELTRVQPLDIVETEDRYVFLVNEEDVGRAVGKGGSRLKRVREKMGRNIDVVAYAEDPKELVSNFFRPYDVQGVELEDHREGGQRARVKVAPKDKGRAIGKGGSNVKLCEELVSRHTDITQVVVDSGTVVQGA
ncbi:MAG: NusA-like transcription termination signal-binding factor [Candidatus Thermoplasmatota archaeon]|nr:NusA-like transcription termination signal-binding factor [Candidatus Thermoplasmatota archaeon]